MIISRLPRLILPNETSPSISDTMAGFDGLRASNSLRNAGQTARDVACLAEGTRYLDEGIARLDFGVLLHHDVCAYRQVVLFHFVALVVEDADDGVLRLVPAFDDDLLAQTGLFVGLVAVGDAFDDVVECYLTVVFRYDDRVERVPFADDVAVLDFVPVELEEVRTVRQVVRVEHDIRVVVHDTHFRRDGSPRC